MLTFFFFFFNMLLIAHRFYAELSLLYIIFTRGRKLFPHHLPPLEVSLLELHQFAVKSLLYFY